MVCYCFVIVYFFFFKQKTAYEMRISDWSSDVCSSDLDVVLSTFGVMFTPNQEKAASELTRVCRTGGKIGLANWTPTGFIGELFKEIGRASCRERVCQYV